MLMGKGGDRKNYVMSPELAMQRELAYRLKLQKQPHLPFQCPLTKMPAGPSTSISSQDSSTTPQSSGPIHGPQNPGSVAVARPPSYPYPYLSSNLRPVPSSGPSCSAVQKQKGPVPLPEGVFTCKVCQIDCKTGFNLLNHYQGHKHKAKLRGMKGKEVAGVVVGSIPRSDERETRPYCDVCDIWCGDEFAFRLHLSCTNRKKNDRWQIEICDVSGVCNEEREGL